MRIAYSVEQIEERRLQTQNKRRKKEGFWVKMCLILLIFGGNFGFREFESDRDILGNRGFG